jgi:uncharacterized protein YaiI (UPF0178 family)
MHLSGFGDTATSNDFGFDFRVRKNGDVEITHNSRLAATLRGAAAQDFVNEIETHDDEDVSQELMQRLVMEAKKAEAKKADAKKAGK